MDRGKHVTVEWQAAILQPRKPALRERLPNGTNTEGGGGKAGFDKSHLLNEPITSLTER